MPILMRGCGQKEAQNHQFNSTMLHLPTSPALNSVDGYHTVSVMMHAVLFPNYDIITILWDLTVPRSKLDTYSTPIFDSASYAASTKLKPRICVY